MRPTWASIAHQAKASQPNWITPLATVTPRLEQEFWYDQFFEHLDSGADIKAYDGGKGLELIPTTTNDVLINLPPSTQQRQIGERVGAFGCASLGVWFCSICASSRCSFFSN